MQNGGNVKLFLIIFFIKFWSQGKGERGKGGTQTNDPMVPNQLCYPRVNKALLMHTKMCIM